MQGPSVPCSSSTTTTTSTTATAYPVAMIVASAPTPAPTFTTFATHSDCSCSVSCFTIAANINIPGVFRFSLSLLLFRFTHTHFTCNCTYLRILFHLFLFFILFCLFSYYYYYGIFHSLFFVFLLLLHVNFAQLWLARCFVQLHYYKLIQHTPTTSLPSIVCGCSCSYTFGPSFLHLPVQYTVVSIHNCPLLLFIFCLLHRQAFAVNLNVYDICFVALFGQKQKFLRFAMFYTLLLHVHSSAAVASGRFTTLNSSPTFNSCVAVEFNLNTKEN